MRSGLVKYMGSKTWLRETLVALLPSDCTTLVSPFFGGGACEYHCAAQGLRVKGWDLDPLVANYHIALARQPAAVQSEMLALQGKTLDRTQYCALLASLRRKPRATARNAALFALLLHHSWNGELGRFTRDGPFPRRLLSQPLPRLEVQHGDSMDVLESFRGARQPGVCLYLDPPYPKIGERRYFCGGNTEMHERLHSILSECQTPWYPSLPDTAEVRSKWASFRLLEPRRGELLIFGGISVLAG